MLDKKSYKLEVLLELSKNYHIFQKRDIWGTYVVNGEYG